MTNNDTFHTPISIEEFKYALGIWTNVISGKLMVTEFDKIPTDANILTLSFPVKNGSMITIYRKAGSLSFKALLAIGKEFYQDPEKCISILLHCVIFEMIILNYIFNEYIDDKSIFDSPYLDIIKDIPIKIGEENAIDNFNWEYILKKFKVLKKNEQLQCL